MSPHWIVDSGGTDTEATGSPTDQARRLLSGASGGGPTGGATEGVDPSSGDIPGTAGSVLPGGFEGAVPQVTNSGSDGNTVDVGGGNLNGLRDVTVVIVVVGAVLWLLREVMG